LQLRADDTGLHYSCDLPNTSAARDLKENLRLGNIKGSSFAFQLAAGDDEWAEEEDERGVRIAIRTIRNFSQLLDVSPCTYPAYEGTTAEIDERKFIAAEARSKAERVSRVHAIAAKRGAFGVYFESDAVELMDIRCRKDMLNFILE
jgi:phage head maturation protease